MAVKKAAKQVNPGQELPDPDTKILETGKRIKPPDSVGASFLPYGTELLAYRKALFERKSAKLKYEALCAEQKSAWQTYAASDARAIECSNAFYKAFLASEGEVVCESK